MLPTVDFFGKQTSRLILGDNPFTGHSYIKDIVSGEEMLDYYTADRLVKILHQAQQLGISAYLPLATDFNLRILRQFRNEGGELDVIFQPYPAISLDVNLWQMRECHPLAIYHQGTTTDYLIENGQIDTLRENIQKIRNTGVPVGLGTHVPEHVLRAEEEGWGIDFYMVCLYNARRTQRGQESGFITGKSKELIFYPNDKYAMFDVIKQVQKPFLVFKLFAGGQVFYNHTPEEYPQIAFDTLKEAYANMKPTDIGVMGVFQRDDDQLTQNVRAVTAILQDMRQSGGKERIFS